MSRFKRDRQAGVGSAIPPSVLMQPIAEKKVPKVVRDTITCSDNGFPSTKQAINLGAAPRTMPKKTPEVKFTNENMEEFQRENVQKVMSMSAEEVQESLANISTMFSASSLEFLRQRGLKDLQVETPPTPPVVERLPQPPELSSCPPVRPEDIIATSLEELQARQLEAPPDLQARMAWTLDAPEVTDSSADKRQFAADERFDLCGNKIVSSQDTISFIRQTVSTSLSPATESALADLLALCFGPVGLVCDQNTFANLEDQPQNELRHHETDMHKLGYTLREACELVRSEVPAQRAIGLRILLGALQRRQFLVDLEAYSFSNDIYTSHPFHAIQEAVSAVLRTGVSSRVLIFALLRLVATDFAPELPSVLAHRLMCHPQSRVIHNNMLELQCLQQYLFSDAECRAADILRMGNDNLSGTPPLLMPHSRRAEVPYETHVNDCISKRNATIEGDEVTDEPPMHFIEAFALSCRWHRVEAIFTETSIPSVLQYHVRDSIAIVLRHVDDASAMSSAAQGAISLEILTQAARFIASPLIPFHTMKYLWTDACKLLNAALTSSQALVQRLAHTWLQFVYEVCRHNIDYCTWTCTHDLTSHLFSLCSTTSQSTLITSCLRAWRVCIAYNVSVDDVEELLAVIQLQWKTFTTDKLVCVELFYFLKDIASYCVGVFAEADGNACIGLTRYLLQLYQLSSSTVLIDALCKSAMLAFHSSLFEPSGLLITGEQYFKSQKEEDQSEAAVLLMDAFTSVLPPLLHPLPRLSKTISWESHWQQLELIYASVRIASARGVCDPTECMDILTSLPAVDNDAVCHGLFRWKIKLLVQAMALLLIEGCSSDKSLHNKAIVCSISLMYEDRAAMQLQQKALEQLRTVLDIDQVVFSEIATIFSPEEPEMPTSSSHTSLIRTYITAEKKRVASEHFLYSLLQKLPSQYTNALLLHITSTEDGSCAGEKLFALCELLHADHLSQRCLYEDCPYTDCIEAYGALMLRLALCINDVSTSEFVRCVLQKQGAKSNLASGVDIYAKRNVDTLLEYVSSMIATITCQYTSPELHAASMIPLLLPNFLPWRCRHLVWKELGEWGLLHLLETSLWMHLRESYTQNGHSSQVAATLAQALALVRSDDDNRLTIVSLGYWELASYFAADVITGSAARQLENIICDTSTYPDAMTTEVLMYTSLLKQSKEDAVMVRARMLETAASCDMHSALDIILQLRGEERTVRDLVKCSGRKIRFL